MSMGQVEGTNVHAPPPVHFLTLDRRHNFNSDTLPADSVQRIEAAFRTASWYRDKWSQRLFRDTVRTIRQTVAPGGLVLIGPGVRVGVPPPFAEFFEPIELGQGDPQLKTLTGEAPTRQEVWQRWAFSILGLFMLLGLALLLANYLMGRVGPVPFHILLIPVGVIAVAMTLGMLLTGGQRWFLLPGGMAIVRSRKRDPAEKLLTMTRREATSAVRYVRQGKTTVLAIELWDDEGRTWQKVVTDREAAAFMAAWQSPLPTPGLEDLQELPI